MKPLAGAVFALAVTLWLSGVGVATEQTEAADEAATTEGPEPAGTAAEAGAPSGVRLPLAGLEPVPDPECSLDDLAQTFPYFKHDPIETAGFNHLTLPFLYVRRTLGRTHPEEALAFSFLLSSALDWAPGAYCTRHAYFNFTSNRKEMQALSKRYTPSTIRAVMEEWRSTHAVGGTLIRSAGGYGGILLVYDREAKIVLRKRYVKPRGYFVLLGDMAADAMKCLDGYDPSEALVEHLRQPRCENHESILDLGRAAFVNSKSPPAWRLYERILDRAPGFTEVRYWYGNQRQWTDDDRARYMAQIERALDGYLVEAPLAEFDPDEHPDPDAAAAKKAAYMKRFQELTGSDHPTVIDWQLQKANDRKVMSPSLRERALRVAARHPNRYFLLMNLSKNFRRRHKMVMDADMAASIAVAAIQDRCVINFGMRRWGLGKLHMAVKEIGRDDLLLHLMGQEYHHTLEQYSGFVNWTFPEAYAWALHNTGRYAEVIPVCDVTIEMLAGWPYFVKSTALLRGIAAAHAGNPAALDETIQQYGDTLREAETLFILETYRDLLRGEPVDAAALRKTRDEVDSWYGSREADILLSQADLLAGTRHIRDRMGWRVKCNPTDRRLCFLYDRYQRRRPHRDDPLFYEMLEWLYPHDPWAAKAVADFRTRAAEHTMEPSAWTPEKVAETLKDFEPIRYPVPTGDRKDEAEKTFHTWPPGTIASALRHLIEDRRFDEADGLAKRHLHLAVEYGYHIHRAYGHHLVRLVQETRQVDAPPRDGGRPDAG